MLRYIRCCRSSFNFFCVFIRVLFVIEHEPKTNKQTEGTIVVEMFTMTKNRLHLFFVVICDNSLMMFRRLSLQNSTNMYVELDELFVRVRMNE
jgi:hypothetical protein